MQDYTIAVTQGTVYNHSGAVSVGFLDKVCEYQQCCLELCSQCLGSALLSLAQIYGYCSLRAL